MTDATSMRILIVVDETTGGIRGYYFSYIQWNLGWI